MQCAGYFDTFASPWALASAFPNSFSGTQNATPTKTACSLATLILRDGVSPLGINIF